VKRDVFFVVDVAFIVFFVVVRERALTPSWFVLRRAQILSLTTFAFMSKQTEGFAGPELETLNDCGGEGCGFTKFYQFKGIVGVYAGFWGFTIILVGLYFIRKAPPPATEFTVYFLFTAAMITFLVMSTLECTSVILDASLTVCKRADYAFASLIFATATIALNLITLGFVWRQWRELNFVGAPAALRPGIRAFGASPSFEVDEEK